jgi:hypothetical protein
MSPGVDTCVMTLLMLLVALSPVVAGVRCWLRYRIQRAALHVIEDHFSEMLALAPDQVAGCVQALGLAGKPDDAARADLRQAGPAP